MPRHEHTHRKGKVPRPSIKVWEALVATSSTVAVFTTLLNAWYLWKIRKQLGF